MSNWAMYLIPVPLFPGLHFPKFPVPMNWLFHIRRTIIAAHKHTHIAVYCFAVCVHFWAFSCLPRLALFCLCFFNSGLFNCICDCLLPALTIVCFWIIILPCLEYCCLLVLDPACLYHKLFLNSSHLDLHLHCHALEVYESQWRQRKCLVISILQNILIFCLAEGGN